MRWWDRRLRRVAAHFGLRTVRVVVGVASDGSWSAAGGSGITDEAAKMLVEVGSGPGCTISWADVEVLVPKGAIVRAVGSPALEGSGEQPQLPQHPQPESE